MKHVISPHLLVKPLKDKDLALEVGEIWALFILHFRAQIPKVLIVILIVVGRFSQIIQKTLKTPLLNFLKDSQVLGPA